MRFVCLVVAILLGSGLCPELASAQTRSIESFMRMKPNWDALQGARLKVEGRYSSVSKRMLRFRGCDLFFQSEEEMRKPAGRSQTVEVTGRIVKRNGRLIFRLEEFRPMPSDEEEYYSLQSKVRGEVEKDWYDLGDWALGRGQFYEDEELIALGRSSYEKGIAIEYRRLEGQDPEQLLPLAEKGKQFGIADALYGDLVHEAYWRLWNDAKDRPDADLKALAGRIATALPGSTEPLSPPQPKLSEKYQESPLAEYRNSDADARQKLHRILYSDIVLSMILKSADPESRNGAEVAARIESELPEFPELAQSYRDRQLDYEFAHVGTSTRAEAIELSERFRRRREPDKAQQTLEIWLREKEIRLRQDGIGGLLQLAEEYVNLLENEKAAADVLMEAYALEPTLTETSERLRHLGYRLHNDQWLAADEQPAAPPSAIEQAIREGRVIPDMTQAQVRKTLGLPTGSARMATVGRITEVWTYGERGTSRLAVHFVRRNRQAESRVVKIVQLQR